MKFFRILDPFTITLIAVVLLASFSRRAGDLSRSLKDLPPLPSRCCFLCMVPNYPAKPLSRAEATGGFTCG